MRTMLLWILRFSYDPCSVSQKAKAAVKLARSITLCRRAKAFHLDVQIHELIFPVSLSELVLNISNDFYIALYANDSLFNILGIYMRQIIQRLFNIKTALQLEKFTTLNS